MTIFPKSISGNIAAAAAGAAVTLFAVVQPFPDWVSVAALVYIGANIFVAIIRALSWCLGEYPKVEKPEADDCIEFVIRLERIDERR